MSVNSVLSDGSLSRVAGGTLYADSPIGTILAFGGSDAPAGWMICDGTSLLRASYPELFAVIGTAFGSADSTHFNIPDMRESVPKGAGLTGHTVGNHLDADGLAVGEFLDDRIQDHTHELTLSPNMSFLTGEGNYKTVPVSAGSIQTGVVPSAYRNGVTTEVKSVGVNYIIKAKMVALPADLASGVEEYINDNATSEISPSNKLVTESDLPKQYVVTNGGALYDTVLSALGLSGYPNRFAYEVFGSTSNKCYSKGIVYRTNSSSSCDIFGYTSNCFIATNSGGAIAVYDEAKLNPLSDARMVFTRIS